MIFFSLFSASSLSLLFPSWAAVLPPSLIRLIILKVPAAHFYLILILVTGLVMALLLGIPRFIFVVSWQRVGVRWGCVLGALLKHPCAFNERPTLSASQRSLCEWMRLMGALSSSWEGMFVDSRRGAFVRPCLNERQSAAVPALLSLTVSECS